jgi:putative effector of murein hydrolase LrgA (UPF0299 family)
MSAFIAVSNILSNFLNIRGPGGISGLFLAKKEASFFVNRK